MSVTREFNSFIVLSKAVRELEQLLQDFKKVLPRGHRWEMPRIVTVRQLWMRHQQSALGISFALSRSWEKELSVISLCQ